MLEHKRRLITFTRFWKFDVTRLFMMLVYDVIVYFATVFTKTRWSFQKKISFLRKYDFWNKLDMSGLLRVLDKNWMCPVYFITHFFIFRIRRGQFTSEKNTSRKLKIQRWSEKIGKSVSHSKSNRRNTFFAATFFEAVPS